MRTGRRVSRFETVGIGRPEYTADGTRAFILSPTPGDVRVIDLPRGREVFALPLAGTGPAGQQWSAEQSHLALSGDGRELTVTRLLPQQKVVLRRVFDARPLTADELAHGKRLDAVRPAPAKPQPFDPPAPPADPPTTLSDHFDRAVWHEGKQQWKEAADSYRAAVQLDPKFAPLRRRLANLLQYQLNDPAGAVAEYREVVRLVPDDFVTWFVIGELHETRRERKEAVAAFREALAHYNRVSDYTYLTRLAILNALGNNLRESGELAEAEKVYREALKRLDGDKEFARAVNQFPAPAKVVGNLAVCLLRQNKVKEAEEVCEGLVKRLAGLIPKDDHEDKGSGISPARLATQRLAWAITAVAEAYLWGDRYEEAVRWADRGVEAWDACHKRWPLRPGEPLASRSPHWVKAVALNWLGKGKQAVAEIDASIQQATEADLPYQRMMRARYVAKSGDHKEAVKAVTAEFAAGNPNTWDAALAYSLGVKAATDDKLKDEYAKEAVALLRKVLDAKQYHYPWKKDPNLEPLRDRDDFKAVLADLDKALAPKPEK